MRVRLQLAMCLALSAAAPAQAQTNAANFEQFQFNLSPPGSRAVGMGGAFIGIADDATATVTNPAGLLALTRAQALFSYGSRDFHTPRLSQADSFFTLQTSDFPGRVSAPPFIGFAAPAGTRWAFGFARHEFVAYDESFNGQARLSHNGARDYPFEGNSHFEAVGYSGSVAFAATKKLRVGVNVSFDRLTSHGAFNQNQVVSDPTNRGAPVTRLTYSVPASGSSSQGVTVGGLYRLGGTVSVGAFYASSRAFPVHVGGLATLGPLPDHIVIDVPDRFGAGLGARLWPRLLMAFDVTRVRYSYVMKDFVSLNSFTKANYTISDATELRLGAELTARTGNIHVLLRGGIFTIPDHHLRFVPTPGVNDAATQMQMDIYNLVPAKTVVTWSVGIGVVLGRHAQFDLGGSMLGGGFSVMVRF